MSNLTETQKRVLERVIRPAFEKIVSDATWIEMDYQGIEIDMSKPPHVLTPEEEARIRALVEVKHPHGDSTASVAFLNSLSSGSSRAVPVFQIHDETVVELQEGLDPRQCCKRDYNFDGNCDIHSAPGLLRRDPCA